MKKLNLSLSRVTLSLVLAVAPFASAHATDQNGLEHLPEGTQIHFHLKQLIQSGENQLKIGKYGNLECRLIVSSANVDRNFDYDVDMDVQDTQRGNDAYIFSGAVSITVATPPPPTAPASDIILVPSNSSAFNPGGAPARSRARSNEYIVCDGSGATIGNFRSFLQSVGGKMIDAPIQNYLP